VGEAPPVAVDPQLRLVAAALPPFGREQLDHDVRIVGQLGIILQVRFNARQVAGLEAPLQVNVDQFDQGRAPLVAIGREIVGQGGSLAALPGGLEALDDVGDVAVSVTAGRVGCGHIEDSSLRGVSPGPPRPTAGPGQVPLLSIRGRKVASTEFVQRLEKSALPLNLRPVVASA
jgi:hypothetical protein